MVRSSRVGSSMNSSSLWARLPRGPMPSRVGASGRGVVAVGAAAGLDRPDVHAELPTRRAHDLEQPLGAGQAGRPRREAHLAREARRGAGDVRLRSADLLHGGDGRLGLGPAPRAQIDLGDRTIGDDVGALAAPHGADVDGRALVEIRQRVQRGDLLGEVPDGAGAQLGLQPGVRGLARHLELERAGALARHHVLAARAGRLQDPHAVRAAGLLTDHLARGRRQPLLVGVEYDADVRLGPGARARLLVSAQRVEQRRESALHVVDARAPGPALRVDTERTLLGRAGGKHRVVVADEEKALGPGARLVANQVIAEAVVDDAPNAEAQALEPLDQDGAHAVDVDHVVGAAVVVHQTSQELDLLVAPAVEPVQKVTHRAKEISS